MTEDLRKKANMMFYWLTKCAARDSFVEFLEEAGLNQDEWEQIKSEITSKTGIEFKYL
tara:strand:+ start:27 stop:200 length:174 start_codon:yes stop_codon:yes gene_type:complete